MKQTVSQYDFADAFKKMDRADNFSYEGLKVLFDYLEELEEATGEEMELDVIAICCDFSEYDEEELISQYGYKLEREEYQEDEEYLEALVEELQANTTVLEVTTSSIIPGGKAIATSYILQAF